MVILLPPSEGKSACTGTGHFEALHPESIPDVKAIRKQVQSLSIPERMKFYSMKDAEKATAIHKLNGAVPKAPCLYALERYTGVVYQYLDYVTLKKKAAARSRIRIVSGLFGLIGGGTKIPNYKMPLNPWLTRYWRERNSARLRQIRSKKILSLLPRSYLKAIDMEDLLHVDFRLQGGKQAAGHVGKAIKGKFVRYLINNGVTSTKDFGSFEEDGYRFDGTNFVQD